LPPGSSSSTQRPKERPLLDFGRLDALINIEEMRAHEDLLRYRKTIIAAVEEV
jgi:hypothetical protein